MAAAAAPAVVTLPHRYHRSSNRQCCTPVMWVDHHLHRQRPALTQQQAEWQSGAGSDWESCRGLSRPLFGPLSGSEQERGNTSGPDPDWVHAREQVRATQRVCVASCLCAFPFPSGAKREGKRSIPRLTKQTHCYEDTILGSGPRGLSSGLIALGGGCVWCGVDWRRRARGWVSECPDGRHTGKC